MENIKVCFWDKHYQYNENFEVVAEWNEKVADWIKSEKFNECSFDYETDANGISNIPRAISKEQMVSCYPDYESNPFISFKWKLLEGGVLKFLDREFSHVSRKEMPSLKEAIKWCFRVYDFCKNCEEITIIYNNKSRTFNSQSCKYFHGLYYTNK